jgi:glycosyltransferase involved in cell wall biosynthesis
MRIAICWPLISGYMAACWRALAAQPDVDLRVLVGRHDASRDHIDFDNTILAGLDLRFLDAREHADPHVLTGLVSDHRPDLLVVAGWSFRSYRKVVRWAWGRGVSAIMTMDTPLRFTARQWLGRWVRRGYFRKLAGVYVPGERAAQLARWLGFPERRIQVGSYGFDYAAFAGAREARLALSGGWPRSFLYVGRYVERKGIDTLREGYRRYRAQVLDPWALTCCGQGPMAGHLADAPGITDAGFVQPRELPGRMVHAGAFLLPSRFEAWGVALAEAGAAGLPLIASRAVGATVEVLRDFHNGRLFDTGDPASLADAMRWVHERAEDAAVLGARSRSLAEPFRAELWAERLLALGREAVAAHG